MKSKIATIVLVMLYIPIMILYGCAQKTNSPEPSDTLSAEGTLKTAKAEGNYELKNIITGMECKPGETISFSIKATNISGKDWHIPDLNRFFTVTLYTYADGQRYAAPSVYNDGIEAYTWSSGADLSRGFAVSIPYDAPEGNYDLSVNLNGEKVVIGNFAKVVADTSK